MRRASRLRPLGGVRRLWSIPQLTTSPQPSNNASAAAAPSLTERYEEWTNKALTQTKTLERLAAEAEDGTDALVLVDKLSHVVCEVADAASACLEAHQDPQVCEAAMQALDRISHAVESASVNSHLYRALIRPTRAATDEATDRVRRLLINEFVWDGANLETEAARARAQLARAAVRNEEAALTEAMRNSVDPAIIALGFAHLSQLRVRLADAVGFQSHAHLACHKNMAATPENVTKFLDLVVSNGREPSARTTAKLCEKHGHAPPQTHQALNRLLGKEYASPSYSSADDVFDAATSMQGLLCLADNVFGLRFHKETLSPEEAASSPELLKFLVFDKELHTPVGVLLIDGSDNGRKAPGSYLMRQIRTRVERAPRDKELLAKHGFASEEDALPVALISIDGRDLRWGIKGYESLMHEFGHALNVLLSRTRFQHVSGIRTELDFSETHSLLTERLALDERLLRLFLPTAAVKKVTSVLEERRAVSALTLQMTAFHSVFDIRYTSRRDFDADTLTRDWHDAAAKSLPLAARHGGAASIRSEPIVDFYHLVGSYAGGYYSYVWSRACAERLYAEGKKKPLAEFGRELKEKLFAVAGGREPSLVMASLVGDEFLKGGVESLASALTLESSKRPQE